MGRLLHDRTWELMKSHSKEHFQNLGHGSQLAEYLHSYVEPEAVGKMTAMFTRPIDTDNAFRNSLPTCSENFAPRPARSTRACGPQHRLKDVLGLEGSGVGFTLGHGQGG